MQSIDLRNNVSPIHLERDSISIRGFLSTSGVANFLGLKYATILLRFQDAVPAPLAGEVDGTKYGPRCPQKVDRIHVLMENMFEKLSSDQRCDELDCLHLNIYAPPTASISGKEALPVFAWIHGGAFNNGDNTTEFDGNHLVRRSMNLGQPIIVVTINYRLNVFGFSSCGELVQEAIQQRKVPVRNQGLRDQRLALQWIQANIHNFGGDAARVTVGGESAGAASVFYHLKSTEPLFHQAFIQSSPLPQLRSFEEAQQDFDGLVEAAGIDRGLPGQEKLAQLRKLSWAELVDVFSGKVSTPIFDPNWFAGRPLSSTDTRFWADIPAWCERVILGHTRDEASLFLAPLLSMPMTEICTVLHTALEGTGIDLDEYKSPTELVRALSLPVTLNTFVRPCLALGTTAASQGKTIYIHEFAVVDPFSGPLNGFAWHSIGNAILFYQPACRRDSAISKVADQLSESLMSFLHGGQPWQAFGVESKKIVLDGAGAPMEEVHPALTTQSLPSPNMGVGFVMSLLKTLA